VLDISPTLYHFHQTWFILLGPDFILPGPDLVLSLVIVKTMSNSGQLSGYSGRTAALQLNSGPLRITPVLDMHIPFC